MRVFVTGATGFIGRAICGALIARGDDVVALSRSASRAQQILPEAAEVVEGDPQYSGDWQQRVGDCRAVVHLAGHSVAGERWSAQVKQLIEDSRVDSTHNLVLAMGALETPPEVFVCASGIDYYPSAEDLDAHTAKFEDDPVTESTPPGSSFLARVCRRWEAEAEVARDHGVRVVTMRSGLVIGPGGAMDKLTTPFKLFVGGRIGLGTQWTSWVALDDVVRAYLFAIDTDSLVGPVNVVSPNNARGRDLAKAIGRAMGRPAWLPVPGFALKAVIGEFAEYILHGRRAVPRALEEAGFSFEKPDLEDALGFLR